MNLSSLTKSELERYRCELNLTDDENAIFEMLSKGKSRQEIANKIQLSSRTVDRRIKSIKIKMGKIC